MMFILINSLITGSYAVLALFLFNHGTHPDESFIRRIKFTTLALAFMCFGFSRIKYFFNTDDSEWILVLGHMCFILFGVIYFITGCYHVQNSSRL